jgi:hypothetical protein
MQSDDSESEKTGGNSLHQHLSSLEISPHLKEVSQLEPQLSESFTKY